jgi:DNA adenine methylase
VRDALGKRTLRPQITPVEKTIWGSPAGKKKIAPQLAGLIPPHRVYVEPFAGSGAVFFAKSPAEVEVLADADPEIAFAFRALATLTDAELAILRRKDWVGRRKTFLTLKEARPRSKVEKLYRFLYLSHFAYGKFRGRGYNPHADGVEAQTVSRIEKFRERLRGVQIKAAHYVEVVKEFDSKDTFFFLDPPYRGSDVLIGEAKFDEEEFRRVLQGIRGKFLVTYGTTGQLDTSGFHVWQVNTDRNFSYGVGGRPKLPQLLISNYAITEKALGSFGIDAVAAVELDAAVAADLDHARALAKALTLDLDDPRIAALAQELDRVDGSGEERAAALSARLLPMTARLAPALKALPKTASAFAKATPVLKRLAGVPSGGGGQAPALRSGDAGRGAGQAHAEKCRAGAWPPPRPLPHSKMDAESVALHKRIPLLKTGEERYVLGVVLEPDTVDAQSDVYSSAEVRDAAHKFMEEYRNVGLMHRDSVNGKVKILESYLAPVPFELDGAQVKRGTWLLAVRVLDDGLWSQIKAGELTGFSIGGTAIRVPTDQEPTS